MFVRERDLTAIIEKAMEALAEHERDDRRHADLNVFFVPVPAE